MGCILRTKAAVRFHNQHWQTLPGTPRIQYAFDLELGCVCVGGGCLYVCLWTMCVCLVPTEARRRCWIPWDLWATMWVLKIEPSSFTRACSAINHWEISPVPWINFRLLPIQKPFSVAKFPAPLTPTTHIQLQDMELQPILRRLWSKSRQVASMGISSRGRSAHRRLTPSSCVEAFILNKPSFWISITR